MCKLTKAILLNVFGIFTSFSTSADVVSLQPVQDATIYEEGELGNGIGDRFFIGRTNLGVDRRALIQFDLSSIPQGSTINSADLTITTIIQPPGAPSPIDINAHRVTGSWQEGPTDGSQNENGAGGAGSDAVIGDVTWEDRNYQVTSWNLSGGDYVPTPSATVSHGPIVGSYTLSGTGMVTDVQAWLDGAAANDGWILIGNELLNKSARGAASREATTQANRPALMVDFTPPGGGGPVANFPGIITNNLVVHHGQDDSENGIWENLTSITTPAGLDRILTNLTDGVAGPELITDIVSLSNIDRAYHFTGNGTDQTIAILSTSGSANAYGDVEQFSNTGPQHNGSIEIWFRPQNANGGPQILWETGGNTGTSFTLVDSLLEFRTRSQSNTRSVTHDIGSLIDENDFIQAVGVINLEDGMEQIELFINGLSVGVHTNLAANNDWEGGDGDAIGGQGQANLGGFGAGFDHDSLNYRGFTGDIAIFRVYLETNATTQTGFTLGPAETLQNYRALVAGDVVYDFEGAGQNWTNTANWGVVDNSLADYVPVATNTAYIGGSANNAQNGPVVTSTVEAIQNLVLGHNLGTTNDGFGNITINSNGMLSVSNEVFIGSNNSQGDVFQNDGSVFIGGNMIYGKSPSNNGGEYRLLGGSLEVAGNVQERATTVNTAQMYIDGGELILGGTNHIFQSFRVGNTAGRVGEFTLHPGKHLRNTGTLFVGNNGQGTFNVLGTLTMGSTRLGDQTTSTSNVFNVGSTNEPGTVIQSSGQLDVGRRGSSTFNLINGTAAINQIRFANDNGSSSGVINIENGILTSNSSMTDSNRRGTLNITGGEFDMSPVNANTREVNDLTIGTDGSLRIGLFNSNSGLNPLHARNSTTIAPGAELHLEDNRPQTGSTADEVVWIAGVNTWDLQRPHWEDNLGNNFLPAEANGSIVAGTEYLVLTSSNLLSGATNLAIATPGWSVTTTPTTISVSSNDDQGGTPVIAAITNLGSQVSRTNDLLLANEVGSDAAGVRIDTGSLILSNSMDTVDLTLGGNQQGTVVQNGGDVTISGDLIFSPGLPGTSTEGGRYTLNNGSLHINGKIEETTDSINNADLHINGGTIFWGQASTLEDLSIARAAGSTASITSGIPITVQNKLSLGNDSNTSGEIISDENTAVLSAARATLGDGSGGTGTVRITEGTFDIFSGELALGGDAAADTNSLGQVFLGTIGGAGNPSINVTGGNTEVGQNGHGRLEINRGTFRQLSNNIVVGQSATASGTFIVNGGHVDLTGGGGNRNINYNGGLVSMLLNDGLIDIGQDWNLGSGTDSQTESTLNGGIIQIGRDLNFRNNGVDTLHLAGATMTFTRVRDGSADLFVDSVTGTNTLNFTAGRLKNVSTYHGSLNQQGGTLEIGDGIGDMNITSNYTGAAAATLFMEINWDGIGVPTVTNHDQLVVQGDLDLNGMSLNLTNINPAITNAAPGTRVVLIDGSSPPRGMFAEGNTITSDGATFTILYGGTSGNDVELQIGSSLPTGDDDNDGLANVLEQAFGTNPNDGASGTEALPFIRHDEAGQVKIFYRELEAPGEFTYFIESTTDYTTWTTETYTPADAEDQAGIPAGVDLKEATFTADPTFKSYRVGVNF